MSASLQRTLALDAPLVGHLVYEEPTSNIGNVSEELENRQYPEGCGKM
jgi:hypothetical protein